MSVLKCQVSLAEQNDEFRHRGFGGHRYLTRGVQSKGPEFIAQAVGSVTAFNDFTDENDPYDHHNFGEVYVEGKRVLWRIDYYDKDMLFGSEDPRDPGKTTRMLTIMLADEY